jgi:hypothetical protein
MIQAAQHSKAQHSDGVILLLASHQKETLGGIIDRWGILRRNVQV